MNQNRKGEIGKKWIWLIVALWILALGLLFAVIYRNQKEEEIKGFESVNRQVIRQIDNVMEQIDNLNAYIKSDEQLETLLTQKTMDPSEIWDTQIAEYLNSRKNAAMNVESVLLLTDNGQDFVNVGAMLSPDIVRESSWYQTYREMDVTRYYSPLSNQYGDTRGEEGRYIMVVYPYDARSVSGDIVLLCSFSSFREALDEYNDRDTPVCICGRDDQIIYSNREEEEWTSRKEFQTLLETLAGSYHSVQETAGGTYISDCTALGGWKIIVKVSNRYVLNSMVLVYGIAALLFCVIYFCVLALMLSRQKIRKAEYAFLSAQINPHFIYKALNTIMFLCKRGQNEKAVLATKALEDILKDKLRVDDIIIYDTLQRELEVIRQYLFIQKIYYNFPIELEEDVDRELLDCMIPKNMLHPLVENALYHGILPNMNSDGSRKCGVIRIWTRKEKEELILGICDNGVGMIRKQVEQIFYSRKKREKERGMHIGIDNIKYRLKYLRGLKHKMEVSSQPGKGTEVVLRIGIRKKDQQ